MNNNKINDQELQCEKLYPVGYYFNLHVTAAQLIRWVASAHDYRRNEGSNPLLANIGWHVLPRMVNCKNKMSRIKSLDRYWNEIFDYDGYKHNRKYLADIGRSFLQSYETLSEATEFLIEFFRIYKVLFVILEIKKGGLNAHEIETLIKTDNLIKLS